MFPAWCEVLEHLKKLELTLADNLLPVEHLVTRAQREPRQLHDPPKPREYPTLWWAEWNGQLRLGLTTKRASPFKPEGPTKEVYMPLVEAPAVYVLAAVTTGALSDLLTGLFERQAYFVERLPDVSCDVSKCVRDVEKILCRDGS